MPVIGLTAEWSILTTFRNHNLNNEFAGTFRAGVALKQQLNSLISLVRRSDTPLAYKFNHQPFAFAPTLFCWVTLTI